MRKYSERVELHCHSTFSKSDGVNTPKEILAFAEENNMPAIAITDHGDIVGFPEMEYLMNKNKGNSRFIYGMEGYFVNDCIDIFTGYTDQSMDDEFVVVDIETSDYSSHKGKITEFGAVRVKGKKIVDGFHTYINPGMHISEEFVELNHISDETVKYSPSFAKVYEEIEDFIGNASVVGYNLDFDLRFLRKEAAAIRKTFNPKSFDLLPLARILLPNLGKYRLESVAKELEIDSESWTAIESAEIAAEVMLSFFEIMSAKSITLAEINSLVVGNKDYIKNSNSYHISILVKNDIGKANLHRIVSKSQSQSTKYKRYHKIALSDLLENREGLLLGTACDVGLLYRMVSDGYPDEDLIKTTKMFDYIEVQPSSNFRYMLTAKNYLKRTEQEIEDITRKLIWLGEVCDIPVVATSDAHYISGDDSIARKILMEGDLYDLEGAEEDIHLRTTDEMLKEFSFLSEDKAYEIVIENSNKIAEKCGALKISKDEVYYPVYEEAYIILKKKCYVAVEEKYKGEALRKAQEILNEELSIIEKQGTAFMYLSVQELLRINALSAEDISSRGTWPGSLVAFVLGLTEIDPIWYDLPLETVYGINSEKVIDFDINFPGDLREDVANSTYLIPGVGRVVRAGTIQYLSEKTAQEYLSAYEQNHQVNFSDSQKNRIMEQLQQVYRYRGINQFGVILAPDGEQLQDITPIVADYEYLDGTLIESTGYDYHYIVDSFFKIDVLGHNQPRFLRMLSKRTGVDLKEIPLNDKQTMELFNKEYDGMEDFECIEIPEFSSRMVQKMLKILKPRKFDDLVKIFSLMHGTDLWDEKMIQLVKDGTIDLDNILASREDILDYCLSLGVDRKKSFCIMESARKGRISAGREKLWTEWKQELVERGAEDWVINRLEQVKYMFPRAHSISYTIMSVKLGWFFAHYTDDYRFVLEYCDHDEPRKIFRTEYLN